MSSFKNFKDLRLFVMKSKDKEKGGSVKYMFSRSSTLTPDLLNKSVFIYNGTSWKRVIVNRFMIGKKVGEFSKTRNFTKRK